MAELHGEWLTTLSASVEVDAPSDRAVVFDFSRCPEFEIAVDDPLLMRGLFSRQAIHPRPLVSRVT